MANRDGGAKLARCRELLGAAPVAPSEPAEKPTDDEEHGRRCPHGGHGRLRQVSEALRPTVAELVAATYRPSWFDTS